MALAPTFRKVFGKQVLTVRLLDGVTGTTHGAWAECLGFRTMTAHIRGVGTATVEIRGSNTPQEPAPSEHHIQLTSVTGDGLVFIDGPVRWIKAMVTSHTSGTITVDLVAVPD